MSVKKFLSGVAIAALATVVLSAQAIPDSPEGKAQVQFGKGGKWAEITYGRPILRGRTNIFGAGADYGKTVNAGAPIWRAGANVSTRLRTEAPLVIGSKTVPAGEYSLFIELKENAWTLVVSNWGASKVYPVTDKTLLWGVYNYTPDKDVVRVPMKLSKNAMSIEQLTWNFTNMTATGGDLTVMWDKEVASVTFKLG